MFLKIPSKGERSRQHILSFKYRHYLHQRDSRLDI